MEGQYPRFIRNIGAIAMGATTCEWILEYEELIENPNKWPCDMPTWVFTHRSLPTVNNADIRFVQGKVAPFHEKMVEEAGGKMSTFSEAVIWSVSFTTKGC